MDLADLWQRLQLEHAYVGMLSDVRMLLIGGMTLLPLLAYAWLTLPLVSCRRYPELWRLLRHARRCPTKLQLLWVRSERNEIFQLCVMLQCRRPLTSPFLPLILSLLFVCLVRRHCTIQGTGRRRRSGASRLSSGMAPGTES